MLFNCPAIMSDDKIICLQKWLTCAFSVPVAGNRGSLSNRSEICEIGKIKKKYAHYFYSENGPSSRHQLALGQEVTLGLVTRPNAAFSLPRHSLFHRLPRSLCLFLALSRCRCLSTAQSSARKSSTHSPLTRRRLALCRRRLFSLPRMRASSRVFLLGL